MNDHPAHAEAYAAANRGWQVFPLKPREKTPLTFDGFKSACTDVEKLDGWCRTFPVCNWGVRTGLASGLLVIDFDADSEGKTTITAFEERLGQLPETAVVRTGGGGLHFYYRLSVPVPCSKKRIGDGIDVRADGGYAVLPGSTHPSGAVYEWADQDVPIADAPAWLIDLCLPLANAEPITSEPSIHSDHCDHSNHSKPSTHSNTSDHSNSAGDGPEMEVADVIALSQPEKFGQRHTSIFGLARGLKFNAGMINTPLRNLKPIVHDWFTLALPNIRTKEFDETWDDFTAAWEDARFPRGVDPVTKAIERARGDLSTPRADQYDSDNRRLLIRVCEELAGLHTGRFYLSSYQAAAFLGVAQQSADKMLKGLERERIIECVERGSSRLKRSNRYKLLQIEQDANAVAT